MRGVYVVLLALGLATFVVALILIVDQMNIHLKIAKSERERILASPVVRVCQGGTFIRSVDGRLFEGDVRIGGYAGQGLAPEAICTALAT